MKISQNTPLLHLTSQIIFKVTADEEWINENWKEQLTAFKGNSITYDEIGNPTSYYNGTRITLTLESGRNLEKAVKGSVTTTYKYNGGLRMSKTVGGVVHNYTYDGNRITSESYGTTRMLFVYDENGSFVGIKYGTTYYIYETNIFGDIVGIYDTTEKKVVEMRMMRGEILFPQQVHWQAQSVRQIRSDTEIA